eukprot:8147987-Lingulodinium_polyedra.AAC.1
MDAIAAIDAWAKIGSTEAADNLSWCRLWTNIFQHKTVEELRATLKAEGATVQKASTELTARLQPTAPVAASGTG